MLAAIVYKVAIGRYNPSRAVRLIGLAYERKKHNQLMTPSAAQFLQNILAEGKKGKKGKGVDGKGLDVDGKGKGVDGKGDEGKVRQGRATKMFKDIAASKASKASAQEVKQIVIWTVFRQ